MHLVVRGTDGELWADNLNLNTGAWSTWINLGGSSPSPPALAASLSIDALDLVVGARTIEPTISSTPMAPGLRHGNVHQRFSAIRSLA